jgi:N-formylglutamate deformylase
MDDAALWEAFHAGTLTHAQWNHEGHLRMACMHIERFELDEAHLRLRAGIIRLNQRHGLVETGMRGYFETMTRVWLVLVAAAQRESRAQGSQQILERCPELLNRELPLRYYSKGLLTSVRARAVFLEPDLAPLPEVP